MEKPDGLKAVHWVCAVCGYVADDIPPIKCPNCGASRENFERVEE